MEEFTGQLGERAIGVTNLMAKTLNITTGELFKRMQDGKIKPEDMLKLADAMGTFAESSAGYKAALNNSMSAQERMKNAWALFAYTVLESGLDEALVAIFTGLSAIVEAVTPLIKYLIGAAKGFIAMAKAVHAVNLLIPILIGLLLAMSSSVLIPFIGLVYGGVKALVMMQGAMATLAMGAGFLRTALMRLWPFLLLAGVIEVWNAFDGYLKGERNWMNLLVGELMVVTSYVDLLSASFEYLYAILTNQPSNFLQELKAVSSGGMLGTGTFQNKAADTRWQRENLGFTNGDMASFIGTAGSMTNPIGMSYEVLSKALSGDLSKPFEIFLNIKTEDGKVTQVPLQSGGTAAIALGGAATK